VKTNPFRFGKTATVLGFAELGLELVGLDISFLHFSIFFTEEFREPSISGLRTSKGGR